MPSNTPFRLAGTIKQYSKKAIPQLSRIAFHSGMPFSFKKPYQANVMKILEAISKEIVLIMMQKFNNVQGIVVVQIAVVLEKNHGIIFQEG